MNDTTAKQDPQPPTIEDVRKALRDFHELYGRYWDHYRATHQNLSIDLKQITDRIYRLMLAVHRFRPK